MRGILLLVFIAVVSLGSSQSVFACVCVSEPGKLSEKQIKEAITREFNESDSVFSGEVVALDTLTVKFKLITMWKGDAFEELTMSTGTKKTSQGTYRSWSCDYNFKVGEKYLVYARADEDNQLVARACTRTNVLSHGQADTPELDILNPGAYHAPAPLPVSQVQRFPVDLFSDSDKALIIESVLDLELRTQASIPDFASIRKVSDDKIEFIDPSRLLKHSFTLVAANQLRESKKDQIVEYLLFRSIDSRDELAVVVLSRVTEGRPCFGAPFSTQRIYTYESRRTSGGWVAQLIRRPAPIISFSTKRSALR